LAACASAGRADAKTGHGRQRFQTHSWYRIPRYDQPAEAVADGACSNFPLDTRCKSRREQRAAPTDLHRAAPRQSQVIKYGFNRFADLFFCTGGDGRAFPRAEMRHVGRAVARAMPCQRVVLEAATCAPCLLSVVSVARAAGCIAAESCTVHVKTASRAADRQVQYADMYGLRAGVPRAMVHTSSSVYQIAALKAESNAPTCSARGPWALYQAGIAEGRIRLDARQKAAMKVLQDLCSKLEALYPLRSRPSNLTMVDNVSTSRSRSSWFAPSHLTHSPCTRGIAACLDMGRNDHVMYTLTPLST
jgi:hypothetical protein